MPYRQRVAICGIPELSRHRELGVTHVLSLLDPQAEDPPIFQGWQPLERTVLRFHDVIQDWPGYDPPEVSHMVSLLGFGRRLREAGEAVGQVVIHCHMGISRSTAATAILLAQNEPGREREAFAVLHRIRPRCWPNSRMVGYADALLDRKGALVEALQRHQREILAAHPDIADLVRSVGRGHELPA